MKEIMLCCSQSKNNLGKSLEKSWAELTKNYMALKVLGKEILITPSENKRSDNYHGQR